MKELILPGLVILCCTICLFYVALHNIFNTVEFDCLRALLDQPGGVRGLTALTPVQSLKNG